jgi:hypothetical protein
MPSRFVERLAARQMHDVDRAADLAAEVARAMHVLGFEKVGLCSFHAGEVVATGRAQRLAQHRDHFDVFAVNAEHRAVIAAVARAAAYEQSIVDFGEAPCAEARGALVHQVRACTTTRRSGASTRRAFRRADGW